MGDALSVLGLRTFSERLRLRLWFVPALFGLAAVVLAVVVLELDREALRSGVPFLFGGSAEGARGMLSTIAQSMLTFTALVFSITMLVLQLASTQLSPRVMRTFLRDRKNQVVLGLFVATFLYTLLVLRDVRGTADGSDGFVPGLSVGVAFGLLVLSVAAFVYYIDHMAHAIRASTVIENIGDETRQAIERIYPDAYRGSDGPVDPPPWLATAPNAVVTAHRSGNVASVEVDDLASVLRTTGQDRMLELVPMIGDFVPRGAPLFRLWGSWEQGSGERLRDAVDIGTERTMVQDVTFGFRQLVDIANRALSPGTNDPTTAVQALDRIHDLLRQLASRDLRLGVDGERLVLHRPDWDDFLRFAIEELQASGRDQIQVQRRLRRMLLDLMDAAPEARHGPVRQRLATFDRLLEEDRAAQP